MQATHFGVKIPPLNSRNTTKEKSQTTKFNELNRKKKKNHLNTKINHNTT